MVVETLRTIAAEYWVADADAFSIEGTLHRPDSKVDSTESIRDYAKNPLLYSIQRSIYRLEYAGGHRTESNGPKDGVGTFLGESDPDSTGAVAWDESWRIVERSSGGRLAATKDTRVTTLLPGQYAYSGAPRLPAEDEAVSVQILSSSDQLLPGFHFVFGKTVHNHRRGACVTRFYWNISADAAATIISEVRRRLDRLRIPFRLKCPLRVRGFRRRDSLVIYLASRYVKGAFPQIRQVWDRYAGSLDADVPPFTKWLAPGLAVAESPREPMSFGMHRCGIIARGLIAARGAERSPEDRYQAMVREFENANVSLARPYLRQGDRDPWGIEELEV